MTNMIPILLFCAWEFAPSDSFMACLPGRWVEEV